MFSPAGWARWQGVSIFSHPPKQTTIVNHVLKNYFSHFSPDFLFLKGDSGMPGQFITRHSIRDMGELYLFQLPLLLLGIFFLFKKKERRVLFILLLWFILYPLGSAFTVDQSAQATRSAIGVLPFQILSAAGLVYFLNLFRLNFLKWGVVVLFLVVVAVSFQNYLAKYFLQYPLYSSDFWGWQYGPKETMNYFLAVKGKYDDLYMSGEFNAPDIFLKFYDPKNTCQNKCKIGDPWRDKEIYTVKRRQLFSLSPEYLHQSGYENRFSIKKAIYYPNGKIAFLIGEIVI